MSLTLSLSCSAGLPHSHGAADPGGQPPGMLGAPQSASPPKTKCWATAWSSAWRTPHCWPCWSSWPPRTTTCQQACTRGHLRVPVGGVQPQRPGRGGSRGPEQPRGCAPQPPARILEVAGTVLLRWLLAVPAEHRCCAHQVLGERMGGQDPSVPQRQSCLMWPRLRTRSPCGASGQPQTMTCKSRLTGSEAPAPKDPCPLPHIHA